MRICTPSILPGLLASALLVVLSLGATSALAAAPSDPDAAASWAQTLERIVPSVVSIRIRAVRPFDTERAGYALATGFVVDAKAGLILTNRHVVGPGPTVAEAVFSDHEEVELSSVYRDPIHDFGIYRFDPTQIRFQAIKALPLLPEHATVGREIRVVGNDAGEKLSILAGTLARLDRAAPDYGPGRFNDFNTFYIQAASSTSGGSSGSPVIDQHGHVVALNAGGRMLAASSYYFPLDRVLRALAAVRANRPIPRGTLQITAAYTPYHEVRRLGTPEATEKTFRKAAPLGHGMLVVRRVSPGGPADGALKVGDVLLSVGGRRALTFLAVEEMLDEAVGQEVEVVVERAGERLRHLLRVGDLHAITPASYLEVGNAILNDLSYQIARRYDLKLSGVYLASPGYLFDSGGVPRGAVISSIAGETIVSLDDAARALASVADGARVPVRFFRPDDRGRTRTATVTIDRRYFPFRRCHRDDATGRWPCETLSGEEKAPAREPATVALPRVRPARLQAAADALVEVRFRVPYRIDGAPGDTFAGTGVILDTRRGLVVTDRDTVAVSLGDCSVTFGGSLRIPAKVVFLHPLHDIAIIRYDPRLIGKTRVRAARLRATPVTPGEKLHFLGLTRSLQVVSQAVEVTKVDALSLPRWGPPRFREKNVLVASVNDTEKNIGGILVDSGGQVAALWFSVLEGREGKMFGLPTSIVSRYLPQIKLGRTPEVRTLGAELTLISLAAAREQGLSSTWINRFQSAGHRRILSVSRLSIGAPASKKLREGDLLLRVGGRLAGDFDTLEQAERGKTVRLTLLRDGKPLDVSADTLRLSARGTERVLRWAGALLQDPPWSLASDWGQPREGVYLSWVYGGSPAQRYGLKPTRRIVAVNGQPVKNLDAFLALTRDQQERGLLRLDLVDLQGREDVVTLLLDLESWPTYLLNRTEDGWKRSP